MISGYMPVEFAERAIRITTKPKQYRWYDNIGYCAKGQIDYYDADSINPIGFGRMKTQGIPDTRRYRFTLHIRREGQKRDMMISLDFDTAGQFAETYCTPKLPEDEFRKIKRQMLGILFKDGWIEMVVPNGGLEND